MSSNPNDDSAVVNYILLDPRVAHDIAYPLSVTRDQLKQNSFRLRKSFAKEIETEFGIKVNVQHMRFWKAKQRLHTGHSFARISLSDLPEKFWHLSFTLPLAETLDDLLNSKCTVHMCVTVHPEWTGTFNPASAPEPGPPEHPKSINTPVLLAAGTWTFNNGRVCSTIKAGERHSADLETIAIPGAGHLLGASMIDFDSSDEAFIMIYADNISLTKFRLHLDSWAWSKLFYNDVTWLRHSPHPLLQSGSIDANHAGGGDTSVVARRIEFEHQYGAPPKVFVSLSGMKFGKGDFWDLLIYATGVDSRGFTLNIGRSRENQSLSNSQVHWLAFPEYGVPGLQMCSGEVSVVGQEGEGHVVFERPFEEEPMIFVAITQLRIPRKTVARLRVMTDGVTGAGFDWRVGSWNNTVLERAGFSFLAIERRNDDTSPNA